MMSVQVLSYLENFKKFAYDSIDPRVKGWITITSPIPILTIVFLYFALIYFILPRFMRDRKAYHLKNVLFYYNLFQIISCCILVYNILFPLNDPSFTWSCEMMNYTGRKSQQQLKNFYFYHVLKIAELVETVFYVLRKKESQVSTLHVYHHVSTLLKSWMFVRYWAGGLASFWALLNSVVHIIMYTYYLLSSLGPHWQQRLSKWKSSLTAIQMIQLFTMMVHAIQAILNPQCDIPAFAFCLSMPNVFVIFYMFYKFYRKQYLSKCVRKVN